MTLGHKTLNKNRFKSKSFIFIRFTIIHKGELFLKAVMIYDLMIIGQRGYPVLLRVYLQPEMLSWIYTHIHLAVCASGTGGKPHEGEG